MDIAAISSVDPRRSTIPLTRFRLEYSPPSLSQVRQAVSAHLRGWGLDALVNDGALIASELCGNVRHAGDDRFELTIWRTARGVRFEVRDHSPVLPLMPTQPPGLFDGVGRGLFLVATQASRSGVTALSGGKVMWAELWVENPPEDMDGVTARWGSAS